MVSRWDYGGAYERHPVWGVVTFEGGSKIKAHDLFEPLPAFMLEADLLFVDPPWNLGNLNSFYTKAGRADYQQSFERFYRRLFQCIAEIGPRTCYLEVGKQYLAEFMLEAKKLFRHVTFYNSTYYHHQENLCYVIRAAGQHQKLPLDGMDEERIIEWVCAHEHYACIGDLCMGRGLVGLNAYCHGKRFVGTDLNAKRLSVLVERLAKAGGRYTQAKD